MSKKKKDPKRIEEFKAYLLDQERSQETINSYMQAVKQYYENFDELSKENMLEYKQMMLSTRKPGTANLRCVGMNCYVNFMGRPECAVKAVRIHGRTSLENVITMEEYTYFLECLRYDGNWKLYYIIRFLAGTGCRISELVSMEKTCLEAGEWTMWTKGKVRSILIPEDLIRDSRPYFDTVDSKYLFPNYRGNKMNTRGISSQLVKYGEKYGIRREVLHAHAFRHFFAIQFLKGNSNLALLQNLLGHESLSTTSVYLQLSREEQMSELNRTVTW